MHVIAKAQRGDLVQPAELAEAIDRVTSDTCNTYSTNCRRYENIRGASASAMDAALLDGMT